jgi:replication factor C small subunit
MNPKKALWTERYRPSKLDELILPDRISRKLENGLYMNFLFYGSPGTGKTSTAKVLAGDNPYMYINCSVETGVDTVRTKIMEFCSTLSVMDGQKKLKVVILDEFDGVSDQYMKALRGTI